MLEPWRTRYLTAMGIPVYVPRQLLPGAASERMPVWDSAIEGMDPVERRPAARVDVLSAEPQILHSRQRLAKSVLADASTSLPVAAPTTLAETPLPLPGREIGEEARFSVLVGQLCEGLLIIDQCARPSPSRDYMALLANIARGTGGDPAQTKVELFQWPLTEHPKLPRDAKAGREALFGYVRQRMHGFLPGRLLVLGNASEWVDTEAGPFAEGDRAVRVEAADTLWCCLENSEAKRRLWQALRRLQAAGPDAH